MAEVIPATSAQVIHSSIAALAPKVGVSKPTVNHFCRSLEAHRFSDFRPYLVQSLTHGMFYVNRNVDEDDGVRSYVEKIFESAMASLDQVHHSLDMSAVDHAVDLLTQAKKIVLFGLGSSAMAVHDAMSKFFRLDMPVVYSDDIVLQRISHMNCDDDDAVVIISHTGRTKSLMELAQLACGNDTTVIILIFTGTPLAREATLVITLDVSKDIDIYMPMVSRLAQLTVVDVLATGFMPRRGAELRDNLERVKEALKELCLDKEPFVLSND